MIITGVTALSRVSFGERHHGDEHCHLVRYRSERPCQPSTCMSIQSMTNLPGHRNMSSSQAPSSNSSAGLPLTTDLMRISAAFISIVNERDFDCTSPEHRSIESCWPKYLSNITAEMYPYTGNNRSESFDEHISSLRERAESHPSWHCRITDMALTIGEPTGRADVFGNLEVMGMGDELVLHAVCQANWRVEAGEWKCYHTAGMRSSPSNTGFLGP